MFFRPDTGSSTLSRTLTLPTGPSRYVQPMLRYIENICLFLAVIVRNLEAVYCDGGVFMSEEWDGIRRSALVKRIPSGFPHLFSNDQTLDLVNIGLVLENPAAI